MVKGKTFMVWVNFFIMTDFTNQINIYMLIAFLNSVSLFLLHFVPFLFLLLYGVVQDRETDPDSNENLPFPEVFSGKAKSPVTKKKMFGRQRSISYREAKNKKDRQYVQRRNSTGITDGSVSPIQQTLLGRFKSRV